MPDPVQNAPIPASESSAVVPAAPEKPRYFVRFTLAQRYLLSLIHIFFSGYKFVDDQTIDEEMKIASLEPRELFISSSMRCV